MSTNPTPGWYQDPQQPYQERWWDGNVWTENVRPSTPPPPPGQPTYPGYQQPVQHQGGARPPESYLAWSIVVTILCCLPLGIPAIINAAKVDSAWSRGDYAEAHRRSAAAKKWSIASAVSTVVLVLLYVAFVFLVIGLEE